jgi:hypothetical protein
MTEDASQSTATNTTPSGNTVMLTSKVPTLQNQKMNIPLPVSAAEVSKCSTVNCLSQFRKRPSMTDSDKEVQDSSFLGPFSKRPTPDHQDFKVSNPTTVPTIERYNCAGVDEFNKRDNMNSDSDSLNLKNRVMAASGDELGGKPTSSDRYQMTSEEENSVGHKSVANINTKVNESYKIQKMELEDSDSEKDSGIQLKRKVIIEDTKDLCVSLDHVMEACVTLNDTDKQCQRSETNASRKELKVQSSDESRQQNTDESAKSDQSATKDNCESVDSRQLPTSEQHKGDSSAPDSHQTKLNCDLYGKVQSCQESLQKVC